MTTRRQIRDDVPNDMLFRQSWRMIRAMGQAIGLHLGLIFCFPLMLVRSDLALYFRGKIDDLKREAKEIERQNVAMTEPKR